MSHFIFVQKLLSANNLTKSFGNFTALDGVSFMVKEGSTSLLLGPNGAGKSTIIKCILGMFHFKGEILVDGLDVRRDGKKARVKIGYVPQQLSFYSTLTVGQQAKFIAQLKKIDDRVVHEKLESMGLWDLRARKVKALSSGEKQRFGISMALFSDPPLLIFDEPISSVDVKGELDFVASVRKLAELGKTIFITTHRPGFAEISQEVIVLNKGKVVAVGSPSTLLNKIKVLDVMYIKLRNEGDISQGIKITEDLGIEAHPRDGGWLVARVPSELKADLLGKLSERGFGIDDLIVESAVIESEYYALLEQDLKP